MHASLQDDFVSAHHRLVEAGMHPLRAARTLWHLSMPDLAEEAGVSRRTIFNIEHREHDPHPTTRRRLTGDFRMEAAQLGLV